MNHVVKMTFEVVMTEDTYQEWLGDETVEQKVKESREEFLEDADNFVSLDIELEVDGVKL